MKNEWIGYVLLLGVYLLNQHLASKKKKKKQAENQNIPQKENLYPSNEKKDKEILSSFPSPMAYTSKPTNKHSVKFCDSNEKKYDPNEMLTDVPIKKKRKKRILSKESIILSVILKNPFQNN
jgi:hypothetical protein